MTIDKLKQMQQKALKEYENYTAALMLCTGTACVANKSFNLVTVLKEELLSHAPSAHLEADPACY